MQMRSPALMNAEERHREIATILALGILRLNSKQHTGKHKENGSNSLDLGVFPSIHVVSKDDN